MNYYEELKHKNDIVTTALILRYDGRASGSCYQGTCPKHGSTGGKCLVVWPGIQGWKCYHCNAKGDVIDLVMHYKNCDHRTAVDYLADRAKMPRLGQNKMSADELKQLEEEQAEKDLVSDMLTAAVEWYHAQLDSFPELQSHLTKSYMFSKGIIKELQIGFAPPSSSLPDGTSELAYQLLKIPEFKGKLALTGLFTFKDPVIGPFWDYFKGRLVFPFWKDGKVVDLIARATDLTPIDQYECYKDKEGNIKWKK